MDNDNNDIEIDFVIARLTTLTNQAKIYGGENVLARCDAKQTAEQVFDMFNRALTAIHTLQRNNFSRQIEERWMGFAHQILSQQMSTEEFFDDVDCIDITVQDRVSDFIAEFGDWASMGWKEENNSTVVLARFLYKEFK